MSNVKTKLVISIGLACLAVSGLLISLMVMPQSAQAALPSGPSALPQTAGSNPAISFLQTLTTTVNDFFLPGTQPNHLTDLIAVPSTCDVCHTEPIYNNWRGSMMSQASRDPLMWAALAIANDDAPNAGEYCLRCHAPKGWLEGRSGPPDGSNLQPADLEAGVACEICHRLVDPIASTTDQAVAADAPIRQQLVMSGTMPLTTHSGSAQMIIDPADNRRGPFALALTPYPFHPKNTYQTDLLNQQSNSVTRSRLCGTCHNVDNPALSWNTSQGQYLPNAFDQPAPSFAKGDLFPIERTFDEWLNSEYAQPGGVLAPEFAGEKPDGRVGACQDCHMRRISGFAADAGAPVFRDCLTTGCLPQHEFIGGNAWVPQILQDTRWRLNSPDTAELNNTIVQAQAMLQRAATLTATLATSGSNKIARVRVINQSGHKLPTGYPEGRRMWLNLKAYDDNDALVFESGAYNPASAILTQDAQIKIYEAKLGLTPELAALDPGLTAGESFHFVLNNTYLKDNRIPPRGYTQAAFDQNGLRPVGATYLDGQYWDDTAYTVPPTTVRIVATLYYQTASKEYIDFLRTAGGADGTTLGQLWDDSKSSPVEMTTAMYPINIYLPLLLK